MGVAAHHRQDEGSGADGRTNAFAKAGEEGGSAPPLTRRQVECLYWVRHGKSSASIAAILGISAPTVDEHIAEACRRLGVRTRVQGVMEAYLSGVLPD